MMVSAGRVKIPNLPNSLESHEAFKAIKIFCVINIQIHAANFMFGNFLIFCSVDKTPGSLFLIGISPWKSIKIRNYPLHDKSLYSAASLKSLKNYFSLKLLIMA